RHHRRRTGAQPRRGDGPPVGRRRGSLDRAREHPVGVQPLAGAAGPAAAAARRGDARTGRAVSAPTQPVGVADADTDAVDACLEDFFARRIPRSHPYGEPYRRLWRSIHAARGGKRLRPALLLLAYRHVAHVEEGELPRDAVAAAAALELLHTAFVVHDDVIDHDLV